MPHIVKITQKNGSDIANEPTQGVLMAQIDLGSRHWLYSSLQWNPTLCGTHSLRWRGRSQPLAHCEEL